VEGGLGLSSSCCNPGGVVVLLMLLLLLPVWLAVGAGCELLLGGVSDESGDVFGDGGGSFRGLGGGGGTTAPLPRPMAMPPTESAPNRS
jgi:hypothetical protein